MNSSSSTTIAVIVMGLAIVGAVAYAANSITGAIVEAAAKPAPPVAKRAALSINLDGNCPNGGCEPAQGLCNKWGYPQAEILMTNGSVPKVLVCFDEAFKP